MLTGLTSLKTPFSQWSNVPVLAAKTLLNQIQKLQIMNQNRNGLT